jgi:hypothetical protein
MKERAWKLCSKSGHRNCIQQVPGSKGNVKFFEKSLLKFDVLNEVIGKEVDKEADIGFIGKGLLELEKAFVLFFEIPGS